MPTITNHPERIGKYEILSVLGRGGMGVVYKARDTVIDRIVAVKMISAHSEGVAESQVERLLMEARSAGRLHHPNIVTVFDFGREGDLSYIVMEYAEGIDLKHVIEQEQPLAFGTRIDIILQICQGLAFAHERGVTHRDMKPANVRITTDGTAKILDFGLARFDDTQLTATGFISGTIAYMSPERLQGETGASDDIFALGAITYELLTSQRAFPGTSPPEIMFKIMSVAPPPVSTVAELPPELDAVIAKCMAREASERFVSVLDFSDALADTVRLPAVQQFINSPERAARFLDAERNAPSRPRRDATSSSGSRTRVAEAVTSQRQSSSPDDPTAVFTGSSADSGDAATQFVPTGPIRDSSPSPATESAIPRLDADPTLVTPLVSGPAAPSRKPVTIGLSIAAIVAAVTAVTVVTQRRGGEPTPLIARTAPAPAPASAGTMAVTPIDQRVARANRDLMQLTRKLDAKVNEARAGGVLLSESSMAELNQRIEQLGTLADKGDDQAVRSEGARILADCYQVIEKSPRSGRARPAPPLTPPVSRGKSPIAATPRAAPIHLPPTPTSVHPATEVPSPAAPSPSPAPAPTPQPLERTATANLRGEITAFIHSMGNAYQNHDSSFFARTYLPYSDKFGEAIRRSASTTVDIAIDSIEIEDSNRARIVVNRTDTLDRNVPPVTQRLVYQLEKQNGQWKILKFGRL